MKRINEVIKCFKIIELLLQPCFCGIGKINFPIPQKNALCHILHTESAYVKFVKIKIKKYTKCIDKQNDIHYNLYLSGAIYHAGVVQWQNSSLPSWLCGFDSRYPLQNSKEVSKSNLHAGVVQWQNSSLPSWLCGFDSRYPLHLNTTYGL